MIIVPSNNGDNRNSGQVPLKFLKWLSLGLVNILVLWLVIFFDYHHVHDENHIMENTQALLLGISILYYGRLAAQNPHIRLAMVSLCLLCFSFLLRELDLEYMGLPGFIVYLGSGAGRTLMLAILWLAMACAYLCKTSDVRADFRRLTASRDFKFLTASALFLLLGALMDKEVLPVGHPRLFEELAEINAYLLLLWPGWSRIRNKSLVSSAEYAQQPD